MSTFLVIYRPTDRYPKGTAEETTSALASLPAMGAHMRYLGDALSHGTIELGGPLHALDAERRPAGGVVIYRGLDQAAIQAFVANDPMVSDGYEQAEIYHYEPALRGAPTD